MNSVLSLVLAPITQTFDSYVFYVKRQLSQQYCMDLNCWTTYLNNIWISYIYFNISSLSIFWIQTKDGVTTCGNCYVWRSWFTNENCCFFCRNYATLIHVYYLNIYFHLSVQLLREQFGFIADILITLGKHELLL